MEAENTLFSSPVRANFFCRESHLPGQYCHATPPAAKKGLSSNIKAIGIADFSFISVRVDGRFKPLSKKLLIF